MTLDQAATAGTLNVTVASGKATFSLNIVAINMQLTQAGNIAISTDGKYSENATAVVTAVRADTGATITNFTGTVEIAEDGTNVYLVNGGTLPPSAAITAADNGAVSVTAVSG